MENQVVHRRGASNGVSSRSSNGNGVDSDQDYELVRLGKQRSWSPNNDANHDDNDDDDHHDDDDDWDALAAPVSEHETSRPQTRNRDEDEDDPAASEVTLSSKAVASEAALPARFYISSVLTLLSLIAYILTLKLGSGVVQLQGIGDLNTATNATSSSSSSSSSTVLVGLTGFVRVQEVLGMGMDMDMDTDSTDTATKPWKGGGYTVQQQALFVNNNSNAYFKQGRTVWFMWLVLGVGLPWIVSLASNTDTDLPDEEDDDDDAASDVNAGDDSVSMSSSTRNVSNTSTRNCGRNFQLVTAGLCLVAAVIPVFSVHCILESRLCQGSFIELQTSSVHSSSASAPASAVSDSYYFPTDATVHEHAQASCTTVTASLTSSSEASLDTSTSMFFNNYALCMIASGLWAVVAVGMLVLALKPANRKQLLAVSEEGADGNANLVPKTASATNSSNYNDNSHDHRKEEESESKHDDATGAPQHRKQERFAVVVLFLTLFVLALYMALIPYWLGGSGLLQVSLVDNNNHNHNVTHPTVVLSTTTWNPPQDIVYTPEQQDMVDDTFFIANAMSCIPLLAVMTVYLLTSLSIVLDTHSSSSRVRVTAVAATAAGIAAASSWMIPATVLRSSDFCTSHTYYEFGFLAAQQEESTAAAAGSAVNDNHTNTTTNNSTRGLGEHEASDLIFWNATDITRHDNVSVDCTLYWPGHVLMWGAFGMTLVTGLLLWNIYSITLASGGTLLGGPMYRELSRLEERDANNNGDDDDVLDDGDNRDDDMEMVEYPREEGTSEIV